MKKESLFSDTKIKQLPHFRKRLYTASADELSRLEYDLIDTKVPNQTPPDDILSIIQEVKEKAETWISRKKEISLIRYSVAMIGQRYHDIVTKLDKRIQLTPESTPKQKLIGLLINNQVDEETKNQVIAQITAPFSIPNNKIPDTIVKTQWRNYSSPLLRRVLGQKTQM
jgi:hypothetical protein